MTDQLQIPRRREGEQKAVWAEPQNEVSNSLENVSLEAVINVLIKRGICTETELLAAENQLWAADLGPRTAAPTTATDFKPVQTYSARTERHRHRHADDNRVRRWAAQYVWSRKIGGLFFGWKWHRKKSE